MVKKIETERSGGKFTFVRSLPCILSSANSINHEKMANTTFSKFLQKAWVGTPNMTCFKHLMQNISKKYEKEK
eukprot:UN06414